ncbi:MAG: peptide chain release factor N(5)-glutamine methyltransferase [Burkholderiales bacterium]|nr:peptide chain release factor N(5)-glutamine methyltransferase [Burkholderiales bacterium]
MRIKDLLRRRALDALETRILLRAVLGMTDAQIAAAPERELSAPELERYGSFVRRRITGEPIAYLTGEREFYSLVFGITAAVLVPRPETELLVDLALARTQRPEAPAVLDLATGSGCVAIAIAVNRPQARVTATDASAAALALARANAVRHGVAVEFVRSDWFDELAGRSFHVIVANPPYVAQGDPHLARADVSFEPTSALVAGPTGYECLERIIARAPRHLAAGGWLIVEHGCDQAARVRGLLVQAGLAGVFTERDLAGLERVSGGRV